MDKKIWQNDINRRKFLGISAGVVSSFMFSNIFKPTHVGAAAGEDYKRIVVLTDVHVPSSKDKLKIAALQDINSWNDVDHVVVTGDLCHEVGDEKELKAAVELMSHCKKKRYVLTGNHDYLYADGTNEGGKYQAGPKERAFKLERFRRYFNMNALYFSKDVGDYHLVYLSPDSLDTIHLTEMSVEQLAWLAADLEMNRDKPTIIFFHGSLEGTWDNNGKNWPKNPKFMAQPIDDVRDILKANPQVMIWVSGHLHLGVYNQSSCNEKIYTYDVNKVQNMHNPALLGTGYERSDTNDHGAYPALWTRSLYLYSDRVEFRTYDHTNQKFLTDLDRAIKVTRR